MKIDKGVPIPPQKCVPRSELGRQVADLRSRMEVGDSVFFPASSDEPRPLSGKNSLMSRLWGLFNRHKDGGRYTTRVVGDGVRVWRIR